MRAQTLGVALAIAVAAHAGGLVPTGAAAPAQPEIFHGHPAVAKSWTFYAGLTPKFDRDASNNRPIFCGGAVVAQKIVVTAAHCVADDVAGDMSVVVGGGTDPYRDGVVIPVSRIATAPGADPSRFLDDVAVLTLAKAVPSSVKPVAVDDGTVAGLLRSGATVDVAGVGELRSGGQRATRLQSAKMRVTAGARCHFEVENDSRSDIRNDDFCTNGIPGTDRSRSGLGDPCAGDSGGPIVARLHHQPVLVGVVSTGSKVCGTGANIQPRLAAFRSFLESQVSPLRESDPPETQGAGLRATWPTVVGGAIVVIGAIALAVAGGIKRRERAT